MITDAIEFEQSRRIISDESLLVISGGQTGADQAGLAAARKLNIPTSGYAPAGFLTERGPNFTLRDIYGLFDSGLQYAERTQLNVRSADVTYWFGGRMSRGYAATERSCKEEHKPLIVIRNTENLCTDLHMRNPLIINVAGNRASINKEIFQKTYEIVHGALKVYLGV